MGKCLLLALLIGMLLAPSALEARTLSVESFWADIVVNQDGSIYVKETISYHFEGAWNGIWRAIPIQYRTEQGMGYSLLLEVQEITDERGQPLRHEISRERHYRMIKVWVPQAEDTTRTVVIRYRVPNALRFFENYDELYWNVTGDESEVPIASAGAMIALPERVSGVRAISFTGGYGSQEQAARVEVAPRSVVVQTTRSLGYKEGLTVSVVWNPGVVRRPSAALRAGLFLRGNLILLVPVCLLLVMWGIWYRVGRDPRLRPIMPQYEPPPGLSPAEVGTLVDNSADMRDITATLVDLAVRGYLRIEEEHEPGLLGLWESKSYSFELLREPAEWRELREHERKLLEELFESGESKHVYLKDLENKFYRSVPVLCDLIFGRLLGKGYYSARPDKVKVGFLVAAGAVGMLVGWGGSAAAGSMDFSPASAVLAGVLSALVVAGFGLVMPARTMRGGRALEAVLGFEDFLSRVEGDRLELVTKTPEMFDRFLPYAMALRVEKQWAQAFADIYQQQPEWYRGGSLSSFSMGSFVSDMNHMSSAASSAMASAPRSSGGSGFGGGGGSGGGSGGGGTGGF